MRISTQLRYGMRLMLELGANYKKLPISLLKIAKKQKIPIKYAEQIMIKLKNNNLVRSVRGMNGGYLLSRSPKEISLLEIFEALDGKIYLLDCIPYPNSCSFAKKCVARKLWQELGEAWIKILKKKTLQSLVNKYLKGGKG